MNQSTSEWRPLAFRLVLAACGQLVLLTLIAMLIYPGGYFGDPTTPRYLFFQNFFSDLGRFEAHNGDLNAVSRWLFTFALTTMGLAVVLFFVAVAGLFREERPARILSAVGSVIGVISGLGYVGVAWTPSDRLGAAHGTFVQVAFLAFFGAAVFYFLAILTGRRFPRLYALAYLVFIVLMTAYLWLLFFGPANVTIQATGQKIIVYIGILAIFSQAYGARQLTARDAAQ